MMLGVLREGVRWLVVIVEGPLVVGEDGREDDS